MQKRGCGWVGWVRGRGNISREQKKVRERRSASEGSAMVVLAVLWRPSGVSTLLCESVLRAVRVGAGRPAVETR